SSRHMEKPMAGLMPGTKVRFGAYGDDPKAFDILLRLHGEEEARRVYKWLALRARKLVGHRLARPGIQALAKTLIERREMTGREAYSVIGEANRRAYLCRMSQAMSNRRDCLGNGLIPLPKCRIIRQFSLRRSAPRSLAAGANR